MNNNICVPNHVGIIMDGNGRWAVERRLARTVGHKTAVGNLKKLCIHMADLNINYVSLYAFSTENFKRDSSEVDFLMNLFINTFKKEFDFIKEKKIKVVFSGRRENLPSGVLKTMDELVLETKDNPNLVLNICLNYGSHTETVDMVRKLCVLYKKDELKLDDITPELIQENMYQNLPPLDFLIRTSGELRLSNFMMFQASYAELYFTDVYFPDFNEEEFDKAILEFNKRERRFGGIK